MPFLCFRGMPKSLLSCFLPNQSFGFRLACLPLSLSLESFGPFVGELMLPLWYLTRLLSFSFPPLGANFSFFVRFVLFSCFKVLCLVVFSFSSPCRICPPHPTFFVVFFLPFFFSAPLTSSC